MKKFIVKLSIAFLLFLLLPTTNYPLLTTHAQAPDSLHLGSQFGFGNIGSLGEGTTRLVTPMFQLATVLVIFYFLTGAFKYLKAAGSKEDLESAKQTILHAIIGFMILMLAYLVLQFIPEFFNLPGLSIIF